MKRQENFVDVLIRGFVFATSFGMLGISIMSSALGFGISLRGYEWMGVVMALAVTATQFAFNHTGRENWTLLVFGLMTYAYGIGTSVIFIDRAMGGDSMWLAILSGILLEALPEPLISWSLSGSSSDPIRRLVGGGGSGRRGMPMTPPIASIPGMRNLPPMPVKGGKPKVRIMED